jgi:Domain of unkown function (DUF1775)
MTAVAILIALLQGVAGVTDLVLYAGPGLLIVGLLLTPVTLEGLQVDREITRVVWTGNPKKGGIIRPDQFEEFPLSARVPDGNAGDDLVFRAFQTYRGGEKVSWTGAPGSDTPAPRVKLLAPAAE